MTLLRDMQAKNKNTTRLHTCAKQIPKKKNINFCQCEQVKLPLFFNGKLTLINL